MVEKTNWFTGIAVISLLIGIFTVAKVGLNFGLYPQYPGYGALPFTLSTVPVYTQTEADCNSMMPYPAAQGDPASDPELQAKQTQYDRESCLRTVRQTSEQTKVTDITLAAFFTFLGLGMLLSRKFLPKVF